VLLAVIAGPARICAIAASDGHPGFAVPVAIVWMIFTGD
jgi:hypothetical protein